ncbi:MAG: hypothetical protein K2Q20_00255, partial [Phycisphaerales bacterium]|nr:hypothetical protein [Phycisphaerales bacterium]
MPVPLDDEDESWLDTRPDPIPAGPRRGPALWVVHMSHHAVAARRGLREGFICVGWVEAGDLSQCRDREGLKAAFNAHYPGEHPSKVANWAGDALRFTFEMSRGELFVFPVTGKDEIHIGRIEGDYRFVAEDAELVAGDSASTRHVAWLATVPRSVRSAISPATMRTSCARSV